MSALRCFLMACCCFIAQFAFSQELTPDSLGKIELQLKSAEYQLSEQDMESYIKSVESKLILEQQTFAIEQLSATAGFQAEQQEALTNEEAVRTLNTTINENVLKSQLETVSFSEEVISETGTTESFYFDSYSSGDYIEIEIQEVPPSGSVESTTSNVDLMKLQSLSENTASQFGALIEIRELNPLIKQQKDMLTNSRSVALVIEKSQIHQVSDTLYQLDVAGTLGKQFQLCEQERFFDQPVTGEGTAFAIGTKTLATASHVFSQSLENYVIVFGYELISKKGAYEVFIPASNVFFPKKYVIDAPEEDVAVFEVDRDLNVPALPLSNKSVVPDNSAVYMIGHPMGLPKKVALNAAVGENSNPLYFYTSLDAFQGNSGSPVFLWGTNEVIGILVSGQKDYEWNGQCNRSTNCSPPNCRGEKVIRIREIFR